jgi:hypothetical protein
MATVVMRATPLESTIPDPSRFPSSVNVTKPDGGFGVTVARMVTVWPNADEPGAFTEILVGCPAAAANWIVPNARIKLMAVEIRELASARAADNIGIVEYNIHTHPPGGALNRHHWPNFGSLFR